MLLRNSTAQILKILALSLASFFVFLLFSTNSAYAAFSLDSSFGTGGEVMTSFGNQSGLGKVAIQPDGKIVVGGFASNGNYRSWEIVRYNSDGTIDTGFGTNGIVTRDFGFDQVVQSIAIQSDGKIVVGGSDAAGSGSRIWTIGRYTTEGSLDTSFNGGIISNPIGDDIFEILTDLKIQPDGRIVAVGYLRKNGSDTEYITLVRYNQDGTVDSNFGTNGVTATNFGPTFERGYRVVFQDNNLIVFGDYSPQGIFLLRYSPNGTLDSSFGSNGVVTDTAGWGGRDIAIDNEDRIIVTGGGNSPNDTYVIRYDKDGKRDTSFGTNGVYVNSFSSQDDSSSSLVLQLDGKIILGGYVYNDTLSRTTFALERLDTNGILDTAFGDNGLLATQTSANSWISNLALQSDGNVVAAGVNGTDWLIARYADSLNTPTSTPTITPTPTPTATPTPTPIILSVSLIKQTDKPWESHVYDGANFWSPKNPTISDWGCALTADAMILKYYGINKLPNGTPLDPGTLNTWLKNNHGYDDGINNGYLLPTAISYL